MKEYVILVNENDEVVGTMEKMEAHQRGLLHRAFSIFIFNKKGEMMLQQRSLDKYHSPGLWTNACCSHPRPGESTMDAAKRRLVEELGFSTELKKVFDFTYKSAFENGLTEHEFDHVYVGTFESDIQPNINEVMDLKFRSLEEIRADLAIRPAAYTSWFHIAFPMVYEWKMNRKPAAVS